MTNPRVRHISCPLWQQPGVRLVPAPAAAPRERGGAAAAAASAAAAVAAAAAGASPPAASPKVLQVEAAAGRVLRTWWPLLACLAGPLQHFAAARWQSTEAWGRARRPRRHREAPTSSVLSLKGRVRSRTEGKIIHLAQAGPPTSTCWELPHWAVVCWWRRWEWKLRSTGCWSSISPAAQAGARNIFLARFISAQQKRGTGHVREGLPASRAPLECHNTSSAPNLFTAMVSECACSPWETGLACLH